MECNCLQTLLSCLILYKHNVHILHWKLKGLDFDPVHGLIGDYYSSMEGFIDDVAECSMQIGCEPVTLQQALNILENDSDNSFISLEIQDYSSSECFEKIKIMFDQLIELYDKIYQNKDIPDSIINLLQEQQQWFRKEGHYKNRRRI